MKIAVIVGSHRKQSQSAKVGRYIHGSLGRLIPTATAWTLDLGTHPLPMWDEGVWEGADSWKSIWSPIGKELSASDALIVIAPEYAGMVPPALKNFLLLCDKTEVGHKPGLIVGVSSGRSGTYPVAELRMSSFKNSRINWIPDHMIVRDAENVLNTSAAASESDKLTRERLDYTVAVLGEYAKALRTVRASGVIDFKNHPNGL
jgi:azobenzene reductase